MLTYFPEHKIEMDKDRVNIYPEEEDIIHQTLLNRVKDITSLLSLNYFVTKTPQGGLKIVIR